MKSILRGAGRIESFRTLALVAGIVGLIFASPIGEIIYVAAMISVIGIPIALLVAAIPTIALVIVGAYLLWRFVPPFGRWRPMISVAAAGLLLVILPPLHNAEIRAQVASLTSGDVGRPTGPEDIPVRTDQTLALVTMQDRASLCDQMCLHLLMSGQAARVLMVPLGDDEASPDAAMRAYSYVLDRRADCPEPENPGAGAKTHAQNFSERTPGTISGRFATMLDVGYCLGTADAKLRDADLAFMVVHTSDFPVPWTVSPIDARLQATRAGVYAPDSQGEWVPAWQQTSVSSSLLGPVLVSTISIQSGLRTSTGWWRDEFDTGQPEFRMLSELIRAAGLGLPAEVR